MQKPSSLLYNLIRPALFRLSPETAHELAMSLLRLVEHLPIPVASTDAGLRQDLWGLEFPNPIGLAAGFDKSAKLPHAWSRFGFGFAELGTITARPQPGNPKPRIFRLPEVEALINRLGFNNDGAEAVSRRLGPQLQAAPAAIPLGLNIGKSAIAPLTGAEEDYRSSYRLLAPLADYIAINVSSPNTKGLRDLQTSDALLRILQAIRADPLPRRPPLLIKISPDLEPSQLRDIVTFCLDNEVAGIIATNTTLSRDGISAEARNGSESGGLSGRPLTARATKVIGEVWRLSSGNLPIVGAGGVFNADDAFEKIRAGANLVQVYTGFVYGGPGQPRAIVEGLGQRLEREGFGSIADAVGSAAG